MPSRRGDAASNTDVEAPCSGVLRRSGGVLRPPVYFCSPVEIAPGWSVGTNAVICPTLGDADGQEGVSSLGLTVGADWGVRNEIEIQIIENHRRKQMAGGAYRYDSRTVCCSKGRVQTDGEREVSEEVGAELKFEALRRLVELRHRHDADLVPQRVELPPPSIAPPL